MTTLVISSPLMTAAAASRKTKYPWATLERGQSFTVPDNAVKLGTLETLAYRTGKRLNKKFKVLHHPDLKVFEVGRIDGLNNEK